MPYVYQPDERVANFDEAYAVLAERLGSRVTREMVDLQAVAHQVRAMLGGRGINLEDFNPDVADYQRYFEQAEYATRYPEYYKFNQVEKSLEHFICLRLLNLSASDVLIDIASEGSPVPEIMNRLTGCAAYAQDIMYEPGMNGNRIGGDACAMPLPAEFATAVTLTCSLEHFEKDADTALFKELARVLKLGGKVIVVPLYMNIVPGVFTDPRYSAATQVPFDEGAMVYCWEFHNRHGRLYSAETLQSRVMEPVKTQFKFSVYEIDPQRFGPQAYVRFILVGEKIA